MLPIGIVRFHIYFPQLFEKEGMVCVNENDALNHSNQDRATTTYDLQDLSNVEAPIEQFTASIHA